MILKAPIGETYRQVNRGDKYGDIWASRNIDLEDNWGKIEQSSPVIVETISTTSDNPQSTPFAFTKNRGSISGLSADRFWALAEDGSGNTRLYQASSVPGDFSLDTDSPNMDGDAKESDILSFNSQVYVASGDSLYSRSSSAAWSTVSTGLDYCPHTLSIYGDRLYISNDQRIYSLSTSDVLSTSGANTLNIDISGNENLYITTMRSAQNGLWIATMNNDGGRAKVFFWDGATENAPDASYKIDSAGVVAMTLKNEVPYILGSNGVLYRFNGSFFDEIDRLPFENLFPYFGTVFSRHNRYVHPNGMIVVRDEILIAVNNREGEDDENDDPVPPRLPSGIWAWSESTGLYHKHSVGSQKDSDTVNDYGQVELVEMGAMFPIYESDKTDDNYEQGDFLVGYAYKEDNSTTRYAIARNLKRGETSSGRTFDQISVFITPEFTAEEILENWQKFYTRITPLQDDEKIVVKYRSQKYSPSEMNITWVNTTSFTSTDSALATIKTNFEAGIDYEFEGLQGDGAGQLAHITNITESGGTYTITLDETITGATTRTARCRLDRWTKIGEYNNTIDLEVPFFKIDKISSKVQIKVYIFGQFIQAENYIAKSEKHEPVNN